LTDIIREEAQNRFSVVLEIPGYFQQGQEPSPIDRILALRFAVRGLQHLEKSITMSRDEVLEDSMSTAIVGLHGAEVSVSPISNAEKQISNKETLSKKEYWADLKMLGEALEGRQPKLLLKLVLVMPV
jgi:6-phosphofructokinase